MAGVRAAAAVAAALVLASVSLEGKWVRAQVHHVVGGDRGWDPSSDVSSWSSGRVFAIGDKIWFTYSAALGSIVELKSKDEFETCDVSNPIRMYTDGLNTVLLDGEGTRYFASSKPEYCNGGLKLHVEVQQPQPQPQPETQTAATSKGSELAVADGPAIPSVSTRLISSGLPPLSLVGSLFCFVAL